MSERIAVSRKQTRAHSRLRRRILLRAGAGSLGAAIAFGIAELGLRLAGIGMPSLYAPDHYCGSTLRSSTFGVWNNEGHSDVRVNSTGFRGPEITTEKAEGVFRIAVLGDSFVEALQVEENATLPFQIQQLLNSANGIPTRNYEVINCGVSGYGTAQELLMLRHHVLHLKPDAVLLAVYPENDIRNNLRNLENDPARPYFTIDEHDSLILDDSFRASVPYITADSTYERRKASLVNRSRVLQILKYAKLRMFDSDREPDSIPVETALRTAMEDSIYLYRESDDDEHKQAWRVTERILEELCHQCRIKQIPVFVFTVSSPIQVYPDPELRHSIAAECEVGDLFYSERRVENVCSASGATFYPLASALQGVADESGVTLHGFPRSGLGLGHWNESGHRTAARILAGWLMRHEQFRLQSDPE